MCFSPDSKTLAILDMHVYEKHTNAFMPNHPVLYSV